MTTDAENEAYFRARHAEARAVFPLLSQFVDITHNAAGTITTEELNAAGIEVYNFPPGFDVIANDAGHHVCKHEAGHAYLRRLERSTNVTRQTYIEAFRLRFGYPVDYAVTNYSAGYSSIGEAWAEVFCNACEGAVVTSKSHLDEQVDPLVARAWFLGLSGVAPQPTPPPPPPVTALNITWTPSPNFDAGGNSAQFINDHWTVGSAASAIARFQNGDPNQPGGRVSAHYMVRRDGGINKFVNETDQAWHNGMPGWNQKAVGIEHEHIPGQDWPTVQIQASAALHSDIAQRRGIPLTRTFVLGHRETGYATACPGDLPIDLLLQGEEDDMFTDADRQKLEKIYARMEVEETRQWVQRLQDWLSKVFKSFPGYARPTDYSGPDVTTGQPRT